MLTEAWRGTKAMVGGGDMTGAEAVSIDRLVGRLETAVRYIEGRIPELFASVEHEREARMTEDARIWVATNALSQDMTLEKSARDTVIAAAKTARETLAADATTASALAMHDAADAAEAKSVLEATVTAAIAAAAQTARKAIADAATEARAAVKAEAGEHRQQQHWIVERFLATLPVIVAIGTAVAGYMFAKGGL